MDRKLLYPSDRINYLDETLHGKLYWDEQMEFLQNQDMQFSHFKTYCFNQFLVRSFIL